MALHARTHASVYAHKHTRAYLTSLTFVHRHKRNTHRHTQTASYIFISIYEADRAARLLIFSQFTDRTEGDKPDCSTYFPNKINKTALFTVQ